MNRKAMAMSVAYPEPKLYPASDGKYYRAVSILPEHCPWCDDDLMLVHLYPGPAAHVVQCRNPRCSYQRDYDVRLHAQLAHLQAEVTYLKAQHAWLLVQVEELFARIEEGARQAQQAVEEVAL
jgi:hypothetical protein